MSLWLEEKYLRFLSPQLDRFHQKGRHVYNFRCPLCGDSETKRTKARGYLFSKQQILLYKCHNCDVSVPFVALLRRLNPRLYNEYLLERLREETSAPSRPVEAPKPPPEAAVSDDLRQFHVLPLDLDAPLTPAQDAVWQYVKNRGIPDALACRLYATDKAQTWIRPLVGDDKALRVVDNEKYLVIPMILPDGEWFGCQMRMIGRKEYITFRWSHAPLKVFGLDLVANTENIYVLEGPLDSLFIPNALAVCGSDLLGGTKILEDLGFINTATPRTYVWDNEPRNKDVCRHIEMAILLQHNVVIWPREYPKDVNDMVQQGIDVVSMVQKRTFQGLRAELEFRAWKK